MQSILSCRPHVAIIMDGNGRWANMRGIPRFRGHEAGVRAIRPIVERAAAEGVGTLTLFAFSSDNWRRPPAEVSGLLGLLGLLRRYLAIEAEGFAARGVRLTVIGRRDRLPAGLIGRIEAAEASTACGDRLHLRIAFDYSARDAIAAAAGRAAPRTDRDGFARLMAGEGGARDVDLLIRTGGEKRLSDFLLWECAYAELVFTDRMWPDFAPEHLTAALADFRARERRFGGLPPERDAA